VGLGAKVVDFAGWEMPIQYSGVVDEYQTVRSAVGLFDVSHMGRILLSGDGSMAFLQRVTTNNVAKLGLLESQYSMVCNPQGGIKDDIFVYHVKPAEYLLCVNASNREKILRWLQQVGGGTTPRGQITISDVSAELAQLALQGPHSRTVLTALGLPELESLKPRHGLEAKLLGTPTLVTRTGYTGELGYELYVPAEEARRVWDGLLEAGQKVGIKPTGLGARDLLRLEMAYLLYGNDINEETTPVEAAAVWVVDFHKDDFIGRDALTTQRMEGRTRQLAAFEMVEKAVPRHGFKILGNDSSSGHDIGEVTSGNFSPLLQKGIGLGYVPRSHAAIGTHFFIDIRGRRVPAVVVKPPFYKRPKE
jgi:glycine cleavage system T protein (aminomethyltransferase)